MKTMGAAIALAMIWAGAAGAEVVKSSTFQGAIERRAIKPLADGTPMTHVYVAVTTISGDMPAQGQMTAAGVFASKAGCRKGVALSTILAGGQSGAAQFEVLCRGAR